MLLRKSPARPRPGPGRQLSSAVLLEPCHGGNRLAQLTTDRPGRQASWSGAPRNSSTACSSETRADSPPSCPVSPPPPTHRGDQTAKDEIVTDGVQRHARRGARTQNKIDVAAPPPPPSVVSPRGRSSYSLRGFACSGRGGREVAARTVTAPLENE